MTWYEVINVVLECDVAGCKNSVPTRAKRRTDWRTPPTVVIERPEGWRFNPGVDADMHFCPRCVSMVDSCGPGMPPEAWVNP